MSLKLFYTECIYVFWGKHLRFNIGNVHGNKGQIERLCKEKQTIQIGIQKQRQQFFILF